MAPSVLLSRRRRNHFRGHAGSFCPVVGITRLDFPLAGIGRRLIWSRSPQNQLFLRMPSIVSVRRASVSVARRHVRRHHANHVVLADHAIEQRVIGPCAR